MVTPHGRRGPTRREFFGGACAALLLGCSGATPVPGRSARTGPDAAPSPPGSARTDPDAAPPPGDARTAPDATPSPPASARTDPDAAPRLRAIEEQLGGRLGVVAVDTASGARIEHRANERFAMCSTFKALLAAQVLARVDRGELTLDQRIPYGEADLLGHAPVARAHVAEGALTVEALCAAAVSESDNTAANLLLDRVGGPAGLTAFLRGLGDEVSRLDRTEPTLNTNIPGDPRDTTTPHAMAGTLTTILVGDRALGERSRQRLLAWMITSTTGLARLRAGLPRDWRVGDKTGTSGNGAANDVAIAWPPGRAPVVIACFVDAPAATPDARNAAHAEVARIVATALAPI